MTTVDTRTARTGRVINQHQAGQRFEQHCADALRRLGYTAKRSLMSRGVADVMASIDLPPQIAAQWGSGWYQQRLLVQCKRYGARTKRGVPNVTTAEWNGLLELAQELGGLALVVARPGPGQQALWWRVTGPKLGVQGKPAPCVPFALGSFVRPVGAKAPQGFSAARWARMCR